MMKPRKEWVEPAALDNAQMIVTWVDGAPRVEVRAVSMVNDLGGRHTAAIPHDGSEDAIRRAFIGNTGIDLVTLKMQDRGQAMRDVLEAYIIATGYGPPTADELAELDVAGKRALTDSVAAEKARADAAAVALATERDAAAAERARIIADAQSQIAAAEAMEKAERDAHAATAARAAEADDALARAKAKAAADLAAAAAAADAKVAKAEAEAEAARAFGQAAGAAAKAKETIEIELRQVVEVERMKRAELAAEVAALAAELAAERAKGNPNK